MPCGPMSHTATGNVVVFRGMHPRYLCFNIAFLKAPFQDFLQGTTGAEESDQIRALEAIETELAERYGMGGYVDSVAVFQEAKRIAFLKGDSDSKSDIYNLDKLMHLRMNRNYRHTYHCSQ
ncbi:hypothetical protein ARMGADRAFT_104074 [Armillaria gallica]|uniref:Uncharacterized protein n=1 Tax=Armillaria gallica TaxID=47427 RepID=A0A2H3CEK4_ARMGA|nr:hypothetical protein ARMGADRAFT_104074 [Armillaria gallica]